MFLYSEERSEIANMDQVVSIFMGREGNKVVWEKTAGGLATQQGYSCEAEAREAIAMIADQIRNAKDGNTVIVIPGQEAVRQRIRAKPADTWHHATGKKTKGHGGS